MNEQLKWLEKHAEKKGMSLPECIRQARTILMGQSEAKATLGRRTEKSARFLDKAPIPEEPAGRLAGYTGLKIS